MDFVVVKLFPTVIKRTTIIEGGGGLNPTDAFSLGFKFGDTILLPTDGLNVAFTFPDVVAAQVDALKLGLTFPDVTAEMQDALLSLRLALADTVSAQTDTLNLAFAYADVIGAITDAVKLAFAYPDAIPAILDGFALRMLLADTNPAVTDAATYVLSLALADTIGTPTDALTKLSMTGFGDNLATPTDTRSITLRYWGAGSTDNNSSKTNPIRVDGPPTFDAAGRSAVKTNNSLGDLTNPVILTTPTFNVPTSLPGTVTAKIIRVWFNAAVRTTSLDTIKLFYNIGAGDVAIYTHGTAAFDSNAGTFTFDVGGLTLTQLSTIALKASYTAQVVASPESVINLDAWCIELVTTL